MENNKNLISFCALIGVLIFAYYFLPVDFVRGDSVTVSATVGEAELTCTASTNTTAFGTLLTTAISTSTPDITIAMSCNNAGGCTLSVNDVGNATTTNPGLFSVATQYLIGSADAALVAGTEGYGIQGSVGAGGSGGTLTIDAKYLKTGNTVGGLATTTQPLSSSDQPINIRETVVKHKAAISVLTEAATDYADTITYSCLGN